MITNNVTRLLESRKIHFTVFELTTEKHSAIETAQILRVPADLVYKTIVVTRPKGGKPLLVAIPAPAEVDLKKLATFVGEKKLTIPTQREAEQLTGLLSGGISPLALVNKGFTTIVDHHALNHPEIHISGGQRGINIRLCVKDLVAITHAMTTDICIIEI